MSRTSNTKTSSSSEKLWNPFKVLGMTDPEAGLTCVGFAPSNGRRCLNGIKASNRTLIAEVLREISHLDPSSPTVMKRLRTIAGPALCVSNHQDQRDTVLDDWKRKIKNLKPKHGDRSKKESLNNEWIKDRMAKIQREMDELLEQMERGEQTSDSGIGFDSEDTESDEESDLETESEESESDQDSDDGDDDDDDESNTRYYGSRPGHLILRRAEEERQAERQARAQLLREQEERERQERQRRQREEKTRKQREKERREREQRERERREREERERREREEREKQQRERDERARQRVEREEAARQERTRKFREEWDRRWTDYQAKWETFRNSTTREGQFLHLIPWPVKSGSHRDVRRESVRVFFLTAAPKNKSMNATMRKECLNWHPDSIRRWLRGAVLTDGERMMVDMVCTVVTELIRDAAESP